MLRGGPARATGYRVSDTIHAHHTKNVSDFLYYAASTRRSPVLPNAFINSAKPGRSSDRGPSERARPGQGCTSIISPSAPAATAALDIGAIKLRIPVPCEGSATTGRCDNSLASATAARSRVLRVAVSNVLMPRSHSTTFGLPPASRYSAANNHSLIVAEGPRLSRIGRGSVASLRNNEKFCMFLAPTWSMSAYSATVSASVSLITSVTIPSPVSLLACRNKQRASTPKP